jgi:hypothetical protein
MASLGSDRTRLLSAEKEKPLPELRYPKVGCL